MRWYCIATDTCGIQELKNRSNCYVGPVVRKMSLIVNHTPIIANLWNNHETSVVDPYKAHSPSPMKIIFLLQTWQAGHKPGLPQKTCPSLKRDLSR